MTRRSLTVSLAAGLAVVMLGLAGVTTVPYVELSPGPAINTLGPGVLGIKGARSYPTTGELDLTTVSVRGRLTLFQALRGWVSSRDAVIPREFIYPDNQNEKQNEKQNAQEMVQSQNAAADAALTELGLANVAVAEVTKGGASQGKLRPHDVIVSVDGTTVHGPGPLRRLIRRHHIGEQVVLGVQRQGQPITITITTQHSTEEPTQAAVGITTEVVSPVKVDITLSNIGGPSAGLMFALGIIDKLGPQSLTGGKHIAGTGTIDPAGVVGPIGGIAEKLLGAREVGATVFLVPVGNCPEAKTHRPRGMTLVRVGTLEEALHGLAMVRDGATPPSC